MVQNATAHVRRFTLSAQRYAFQDVSAPQICQCGRAVGASLSPAARLLKRSIVKNVLLLGKSGKIVVQAAPAHVRNQTLSAQSRAWHDASAPQTNHSGTTASASEKRHANPVASLRAYLCEAQCGRTLPPQGRCMMLGCCLSLSLILDAGQSLS